MIDPRGGASGSGAISISQARRHLGRLAGLAIVGVGFGLLYKPAAADPPSDGLTPLDRGQDDQAIRALIARMEAAWNQGDFEGYMAGFKNPDVIFVSKGRVRTGWRDTLEHYIRDYGAPGRRGVLHFSDIQIEFLAPDAAQLISHYRLERPAEIQDGINTRLMRQVSGQWVIALNHVSYKEDVPPSGCRE